MKSIKSLALIVASVALFPAASFAGNVSGNVQTTNLDSVTIGNHNVLVTETKQSIIDLQKSGHYGTNASGTVQGINATTATVGTGNIDIKKAEQEALSAQQGK